MTLSNDERSTLYRDLARTAQEVQILADVLDNVSGSASAENVVHILVNGIKDVLPTNEWNSIELVIDEGNQGLHVFQVVGSAGNRYWSNVRRGVLAAASDLGVSLRYLDGEPADQIAHLDTALAAHPDAIALAPMDAGGLQAGVTRVQAAGIPLVAFDAPLPNREALVYVGTDNYAAGQLAAQALKHLLPEGGEVGVMLESTFMENTMERVMGAESGLGDSQIQLLPPQESQFDAKYGVQLARELLQQHPDLKGAFGACGSGGPSWAAAARDTGRAGTLKIVSFDVTADTISQLQAGAVHAVIAQREFVMGYQTVETLCRLVLDGVEPTLAMSANHILDTGIDIVTLERTDWSIALADYLHATERRQADLELRRRIAARSEPIQLYVIGMVEKNERDIESYIPFDPASFIGDVLTSGRASVGVGEGEARTLVGIPLVARGVVLGAIRLTSSVANACSPADLTLLKRIASALAIVVENARLFRQIEARTQEVEQAYTRQQAMLATINELSNTVVPIAQGVLIVPMVGAIDTARATLFVEMLLTAISERQAEVVIIDITGVSVVDTAVAHHILQAARAAQLLGAEVIVVGITPAVAQTIVQLGVQLTGVGTFADLETGFAYALGKVGGRLVYDQVTR